MPEERSPGGSTIHRYSTSEWAEPHLAAADDLSMQFGEAREKVYQRLFGKAESVYHEVFLLRPHVDVFTHARSSPQGKVCALVTGGMSDLPMNVPPAAGKAAPRRVELIFYCSEPKQEYLETLRWLARFPHDQNAWLSYWHTLPNGNPPAPVCGSEILDTFLFMPTIVKRDQDLPKQLILAGDPVHFLWVVPISSPECKLKLEHGFGAIVDLFQRHRHPHVFDPRRKSYV